MSIRSRLAAVRSPGSVAGALALLLTASPALAQAPAARDALLVEPGWLMENLDRDDLVVIHVARNEEAMADLETVPGAAVMHLGQISYNQMEEGEAHAMLDVPDDLTPVREAFEAAGVSDDSRIVVLYDGGAFPNASRTVWTLQFLGRDQGVSILDGGLEAWIAAGGEVAPPVTPARGSLTVRAAPDRRVDGRWVLDHGQDRGIALIDARRPASYDGTRPEAPGRMGHIPGAGSLPQTELYQEDGRLRPASELRSLFEAAGYEEGDQVVAYCHIGYWASAVVFAARTLGWDAVLYDGSMTEWAADAELPLVVPGGGG